MPLKILLIALYVIGLNFGLAAIEMWLLRRRGAPPRWMDVVVLSWAAAMSFLFLLQVFEPLGWTTFLREQLYLPMAIEMVWNVLWLQALAPVMILIVLIVRRIRMKPAKPLPASGISRRRFLYLMGFGAAPATSIAMGVHGAWTEDDLRVREFSIPIANLPPELEGFSIGHVSDLHSGLFVGPRRLRLMSDMTNDLKSDMIVVTGDLINRDMVEFPAALAAIQRLDPPCGLFLCEGNHDVIPGPCMVLAECYRNGLRMIYNRCLGLNIRGRRLLLGGIGWERGLDMEIDPGIVARLYPPRAENDVRVLLAHHPHLFDIAQDVDLVLSGHTHGGQIMFGDVGLGKIRFKYCSGLFQRGNTTLIVNNGCGDWFPCRIGAPAEIGLLRLTKAKTA
jgi:predicted MPP superfamily phosphohydrolase